MRAAMIMAVARVERRNSWAGLAFAFAAAVPRYVAAQDTLGPSAVPPVVAATAAERGSARVIVRLRDPESALDRTARRASIRRSRTSLTDELRGTAFRVRRRFDHLPIVALEASPDALVALARSALVTGIEEDALAAPSLADSIPLVEADQAWAEGFDGAGWSVAVLDTGVAAAHPFLASKVVAEACFSGNGNCPNGSTTQVGAGAAAPCTYAAGSCSHGTHVAGIAAGQGVSFSGVARGANVIAIQVFSRFDGATCSPSASPCALSYSSDQLAGLQHVFALSADHQIAAANMSIGGGVYFSQASCDGASPSRKAAIDLLRAAGIATVIAAGNDGEADGLSMPGCISSAISVGATSDEDVVASFSNSASFLSLFAPGVGIVSSVPTTDFSTKSGTSMAAPHVAGAWAVLKQRAPNAGVDEIFGALTLTGHPILDPRNGITKPRLRVFPALAALDPNAGFWVLPPCRLVDTRIGLGVPGSLVPNQKVMVPAVGSCGISSSARALALNLTIVDPRASGVLSVFPGDQLAAPSTSTLNFAPGQTRANNAQATLAIDGTGTLAVRLGSSGPADLVVDVTGYFN